MGDQVSLTRALMGSSTRPMQRHRQRDQTTSHNCRGFSFSDVPSIDITSLLL